MKKLLKFNKLLPNQRASCWLELISAGAIFLGVLVLRFTPAGGYFFCVFHKITGLPCVFCGMTRSLQKCIFGNFSDALNYHLFGPALFLIIILWGGYRTFCAVLGYSLKTNFISKKNKKFLFYAIIIILVVYWILRLLKIHPFLLPE